MYNVTFIMEASIQEEWLAWVRYTLLPQVMEGGYFVSNRLLKVLDSPNEGVTYCLQYVAETQQHVDRYLQTADAGIQQLLGKHFGNQLVAFTTTMQYLDPL